VAILLVSDVDAAMAIVAQTMDVAVCFA